MTEDELLKKISEGTAGYGKSDVVQMLGVAWVAGWRQRVLTRYGLPDLRKKRASLRREGRKNKKGSARAAARERPMKNKIRDPFYSSWEWKAARFDILEKYGPTCMLCGYEGPRIVVDHIKPRRRYPELELDRDNLQVLCNDCNMGKGSRKTVDLRPAHTASEEAELELAAELDKRI